MAREGMQSSRMGASDSIFLFVIPAACRKPAVVLLHSFKWLQGAGLDGDYTRASSERDFHEFAKYYGLPEISVKAAAWNLMRTGERSSEGSHT